MTRRTFQWVHEAQDSVAAFLDELCVVKPGASVTAIRLFTSWKTFCKVRGERPGHVKVFNDTLEKKGFKRREVEKGIMWFGLALNEKAAEQAS